MLNKLKEMRNFYEGLHKLSSHVSVCAYGFAEAVQDMGKYLINNYGPMDDENAGNVLRMVGKVQLDISQSLDLYAAHVSNTLTIPTESMLHELQVAEETKLKYDEKRGVYDHLRLQLTKGRPKNRKSEIFAEQQLQTAKHQFDELAMSVDCRVLSLEQGRFHNIITKVSRHHTAQVHLFRKAFASVSKIEPYIDLVAQESKIDHRIYFNNHNNDSDDGRDPTGNVMATSNEHDDSISSSSLEQTITQEKIIDDESLAAWLDHDGSESVPITSVEFPQGDIVKTFQNLLRESSFQNIKASDLKSSTQVSSNPKRDQEFPHSITTYGTSASPLTIRRTIRELPGELETSYIEYPEDQGMVKRSVAEDCNTEMLTKAESGTSSALIKSHVSMSGHNLQPLPPQFSVSASVPLPPLLAHEKLASFKLDGPILSQVSQRHGSGPARLLNKRYSQSGPLTPMGNYWSAGKVSIPKPIVLPPTSNVHLEAFFKSGPLGLPAGVHPFILPRTPPSCSPPHISELYKLPAPPPCSDSEKSKKQSLVSAAGVPIKSVQIPSGSSLSHAAPLPLPPQIS
ncbi:hypothetical protein O6H91_16G019700 [Diphasiastrum complanatum]|uniref:Uncharacterized protein n=1 Tax=Diphasiastrum complanatum TaxID=34168 RepID=A0ACC2BBE9_DIPCM|nr:hypothetical protein O6H91_16G019700 [Diphasiastrum complanatum]